MPEPVEHNEGYADSGRKYLCRLSNKREKKQTAVQQAGKAVKGKSAYGPLIADTVLSMLEYVADDENNLRKMRQKEGIALAKERGIIFGRQEKSTPEFQKAYNMWRNKEISA